MRRLELDFLQQRPAASWAGWLLLAVAAAFALDLGRAYEDAQAARVLHEARLAQAARAAPSAPARRAAPGEIEAARDTIRRLATPWSGLFAALESAATDGVALLAVTPDARSASVVIAGEARDYDAVLAYVVALRRAPPLGEAYLARHEQGAGSARHPVAFTVRAPWGQR